MARRLIPKPYSKGYTQESHERSVTRTSNEKVVSVVAKNEQEKFQYRSTIGNISKDDKNAQVVSRRGFDLDYAKMRAYEKVKKLHSFEKYDKLKGRSNGAESAKKIKHIDESKTKLSLPDLMLKVLRTRVSKNLANEFQPKTISQNTIISRGGIPNTSNIATSTDDRNNAEHSRDRSDRTPLITVPKPPNRERSSHDKIGEFRMRRLMPNMNRTEYESRSARRKRTRETKIWLNSNHPRTRLENILPPPIPQSKHHVLIVSHEDLVKSKNNPAITPSAKKTGPLQTIKEESFVADDSGSRYETQKFNKNALSQLVAEKNETITINTPVVKNSDVDDDEVSKVIKEGKTQEIKLTEVKVMEGIHLSALPPLPRQNEARLRSLVDCNGDAIWKLTIQEKRQRPEKPKSEPPRASWRNALENKNRPKSLKKYTQREITSAVNAWSPTSRRQTTIDDLRGEKRTFSAGSTELNNPGNRDIFSRNSISKKSAISDIPHPSDDMQSTIRADREMDSSSDFKFIKNDIERKAWQCFLDEVREENMTKNKSFFF